MNVAICNLFWFVLLLSEICVDLPYFPKVAIALKGQICWNETAGLALGHRQLLLQLFRRFWHCGTLSCQCQLLFPGASVAWWLKHIFYFNLPPHRWSCVMWGAIVFFFQMGYSTTRWLLLCFSGSKLFPKKWNWDPTKTVRILAETNGSCSMVQPKEGQFFPGKLPSPLHESMISMMYTGTVCLIKSLINSVWIWYGLIEVPWASSGRLVSVQWALFLWHL